MFYPCIIILCKITDFNYISRQHKKTFTPWSKLSKYIPYKNNINVGQLLLFLLPVFYFCWNIAFCLQTISSKINSHLKYFSSSWYKWVTQFSLAGLICCAWCSISRDTELSYQRKLISNQKCKKCKKFQVSIQHFYSCPLVISNMKLKPKCASYISEIFSTNFHLQNHCLIYLHHLLWFEVWLDLTLKIVTISLTLIRFLNMHD